MKTPLFPGKYHQKGGFSMAMLVLGRVAQKATEKMVAKEEQNPFLLVPGNFSEASC